MIVMVVAQSKGGVGKTTLSVNVAGEITRHGRSVSLVDADPQGSAFQWAEMRRLGFPVRQETLTPNDRTVWVRNVLKTGTDVIVVDLPAGFGDVFETAVMIADLLIVPCGPSSLDIGAAEATIGKAREVRRGDLSGPPLKIATVPTRVDLAHDEGTEIVEALLDLGEPVAPSLSYDVDFVRSFTAGVTVTSSDEDTRAAAEVRKLALFLVNQVLPRQGRLSASSRSPAA